MARDTPQARIIVTLHVFDSPKNAYSAQFQLRVNRRALIAREKINPTTALPCSHHAVTRDDSTVEVLGAVGPGVEATRETTMNITLDRRLKTSG